MLKPCFNATWHQLYNSKIVSTQCFFFLLLFFVICLLLNVKFKLRNLMGIYI